MKIRLMGTKEEIETYLKSIPKELILEQSGLYANRGNSKFYRCYLEVKTETIKTSAYNTINQLRQSYTYLRKLEEIENEKRQQKPISTEKGKTSKD